jgi:signal transduction histidine kinase
VWHGPGGTPKALLGGDDRRLRLRAQAGAPRAETAGGTAGLPGGTPNLAGAAADLAVALRRIVVGYRVVASGWLALLAVIGVADGTLGVRAALLAAGLALVWAVATMIAADERLGSAARWAFLAADAVIGGATLVLPALIEGTIIPFAGGYPFSTVVVGAWLLGMRGALGAAGAMVGASAVRLAVVTEAPLADLVSTALFYALAGVVLAWGIGLLRRTEEQRILVEAALVAERADRLVAEERAATAAHLHDSVLQTLALIQRRSADPEEVAALARRQERELRDWLRSRRGAEGGETGFIAAVKSCAQEVETLHRIHADVITVGDRRLDDAGAALVAAAREALVNAAKHAGVDRVSLYAEANPDGLAVFVRDRGVGFDPHSVAADRQGIASSIVERLHRHGGTASVRSRPGGGTEWELRLPTSPQP